VQSPNKSCLNTDIPSFKDSIPEGGKDEQLTSMIEKKAKVKQNSFTIHIKEIQATKYQQYLKYKSKLSSKVIHSIIKEEH